ncbi:MAG: hypothetical protein II007_07575 [Gammaproteobacteria bacterium]|nr:hypothetical protein [Gammaproteobacteria bacterium]
MSHRLATRIALLLLAFGLLLLAATLLISHQRQQALTLTLAEAKATAMAETYFEALNTLMLGGATSQSEMLRNKLVEQAGLSEARVIRGEAISAMFGPGQQVAPMDELDRKALAGERQVLVSETNGERHLTLMRPLVMTANHGQVNCLSCHATSKEGDIGGAVRISFSLAAADTAMNDSLWHLGLALAGIFTVGVFALWWWINRTVAVPLTQLGDALASASRDADLRPLPVADSNDELGVAGRAVQQLLGRCREGLSAAGEESGRVQQCAQEVQQSAEQADQTINRIADGTTTVASAMVEMDASAGEVAGLADQTASRLAIARTLTEQGEHHAEAAVIALTSLNQEMQGSAARLAELDRRAAEMSAIVTTIATIAEQTNLLALNAAIEAARAGEQGRGFAVVADEVRTLATRTQSATSDIRTLIERVQQGASATTGGMAKASQEAASVEQSMSEIASELRQMASEVELIANLGSQVAVAARQQSSAVAEMSEQITSIRDLAASGRDTIAHDRQISAQLVALANTLDRLVKGFRLR